MYSYLIGVIILGIIWLVFFFLRKDLRRQQLVMSIFTAPLAPISQVLYFSKDYWNPDYIFSISINNVPIGIEEPLFAFFVGGIGTILYEVVRNKSHKTGVPRPLTTLSILSITVLSFFFLKIFEINTIWASTIALTLGSIIMIFIDKDLKKDAFFSGIFFVFIAFVIYIFLIYINPNLFDQLWINGGLSGLNFFKIPMEETLWFLSWGTFSGILYEFHINVQSYKKLS